MANVFLTGGTGYLGSRLTLPQMLRALTAAVENPVKGIRIVPVSEIRAA